MGPGSGPRGCLGGGGGLCGPGMSWGLCLPKLLAIAIDILSIWSVFLPMRLRCCSYALSFSDVTLVPADFSSMKLRMPCPALPCPALPCPALPCPASDCEDKSSPEHQGLLAPVY